jgi:hypothetical protein
MKDAERLAVVHLHAPEELFPLSPDAHGLIVDHLPPGFPKCTRQTKQLTSCAQSIGCPVRHESARGPSRIYSLPVSKRMMRMMTTTPAMPLGPYPQPLL